MADAGAEATKCHGISKAGKPCGAMPQPGKTTCVWHDPARAAERADWGRRGGKARSNAARARKQLPDGVMSLAELRGLLGVVLRGVILGRFSPGVGTATASLARTITDIQEAQEFEERLARLEAATGAGGQTP